jgi:AcrR family transcriptional regulator
MVMSSPNRSGLSARRSRRNRARPPDRSEEILTATERLLAVKDLQDLTVDDIATAVGINRATFYFYFESKYAAVRTLVDRVTECLLEDIAPWTQRRPDEPPREAIQRAITATVAAWAKHGPVLRAASASWLTVPEMRDVWENVIQQFIDVTATRIAQEREAGIAPHGIDAKNLATGLIMLNERLLYVGSTSTTTVLDTDTLIETISTIWSRTIYGVCPVID